MDYKEVIDNIYNEVKPLFGQGKVADYIPALANINPRQYGIAIATLDGQIVGTGDYQTKFSIQSISKVFTLAMVVRHMGGDLWKYVGRGYSLDFPAQITSRPRSFAQEQRSRRFLGWSPFTRA